MGQIDVRRCRDEGDEVGDKDCVPAFYRKPIVELGHEVCSDKVVDSAHAYYSDKHEPVHVSLSLKTACSDDTHHPQR